MSRSTKLEDVEQEIQEMERQQPEKIETEDGEVLLDKPTSPSRTVIDEMKEFVLENMVEIVSIVFLVILSNSSYINNLLMSMGVESEYVNMLVKSLVAGTFYITMKNYVF